MGKLLTPNFAGIPQALINNPSWVCWAAVPRAGKISKVPIQARGPSQGYKADVTNPDHLVGFSEAKKYYEMYHGEPSQGGVVAGVGFAFDPAIRILGVDLDNCIEDGRLAPWANDIVTSLGGWAEISPSGKGVHVYVRGELPWAGRRSGNVEIYSDGRFFTVTGRWLDSDEELFNVA